MPELITTDNEKELLVKELRDEENVLDDETVEQNKADHFNITSYGADYTVDSLVKRMGTGAFFVPPFQRLYVWNIKQASKFIESLLLGLPVPGIFVFREAETQKHLIIDGQQRLKSLEFFYGGIFKGKEFKLQDVREPWVGRSYKELDQPDRLRLDDSIVHTTVFRQEYPQNDDQSVYEVFERINSGGMKLSAQEIRACVSYGQFTSLLRELNQREEWRRIYGQPSVRMKDEELILRFLAFYYERDEYRRPFARFLNSFLARNTNLNGKKVEFSNLFADTIRTAVSSIGDRAFRPEGPLNTAVFDAVMVGLAERLRGGGIRDLGSVATAYATLLENPKFQAAYRRSTADEEQVKERMRLAVDAFAAVP